jgi:hypothetical protein
MRHRRLSCWRTRFKISLEVVDLDVAAPFMVVLDGDATILPPTTVDELIRHARRWQCMHSRGECECAIAGSYHPPSWCGVLMPATTN